MTKYIDTCKAIKATDTDNKMVAAVHEMGHYLIATTIKPTLFTVTVDNVQLLPSPSNKWYGFTRVNRKPKNLDIDPTTYNLEINENRIQVAIAGMCAEKAIFGTFDSKGYSDDLEKVNDAISFIQSNKPGFDIDKFLNDSEIAINNILSQNLDIIARRAIIMHYKPLNAVIQYPQDIDKPLQ